MKKASVILIFFLTLLLASCTTLQNFLKLPDYTVQFKEDPTIALTRCERLIKNGDYMKSFRTVDYMGKKHNICIIDENYIQIDKIIYAYKVKNAMYHGLTLGGSEYITVDGTERIIGMQGYATSLVNPESTVSFIFAQKLLFQKSYKSMYEAGQIKGVSFHSGYSSNSYMDDFGNWKKYTIYDCFEKIFGTTKQDVRQEMYCAIEKAK